MILYRQCAGVRGNDFAAADETSRRPGMPASSARATYTERCTHPRLSSTATHATCFVQGRAEGGAMERHRQPDRAEPGHRHPQRRRPPRRRARRLQLGRQRRVAGRA